MSVLGAVRAFPRSTLGSVMLAWMAGALVVVLTFGLLMEKLPLDLFAMAAEVYYVGGALLLLIWSVSVTARRPRNAWPAPTILVLFCGLFLLALEPLLAAGGFLSFWPHRTDYDAVVADAQAGRLPPSLPDRPYRWAHGVRYLHMVGEREVIFPWMVGRYSDVVGVAYDDPDCSNGTPRQPLPQSDPDPTGEAAPPTMKHAGRRNLWGRPLEGRYCLIYFPGW